MSNVMSLAQRLKAAQPQIAHASTEMKNRILLRIADHLCASVEEILEANRTDISSAAQNGIPNVMLDRLSLSEARIHNMADGVRKVARLADPIGEVLAGRTLPNGLKIRKERVPIGVVGMIYESRPNVTVDAAVLCLKASNAVMLRGGKEAICTNMTLTRIMQRALVEEGLNPDILLLVEDTSRASATEMMKLNGYLDVLIPRGGQGLIRSVVENATVPVIETGAGNCHVYIDEDADLEMGANIVYNAKTSRPSVCNAEEVCLVHRDVAAQFLPLLKKAIVDDRAAAGLVPVELRLDPAAARIIDGTPAGERDFDTEFLDYILAVGVVDSVDAAIAHIAAHSTHHSDCIVTEDAAAAKKFAEQVDSAAVYVNVSTRFTDGGEFGLGCELGISTQKLHARGPMGLQELTSWKYIVRGNGQIR